MNPFAKRQHESVAAWGEEKLILAIRRWLGSASPRSPFGIGDDCAVLAPSHGRQLITVDPVIYGRHFDDNVSPRAVGAKLVKRNLSDLAAMGGRPVAAVLALTLDASTRVSWLEAFYRGLAESARRYHVAVVGGDIAEADGVIAASLTLLGEATGSRILTRSGAKRGDWIYVTGTLGNSRSSGHHFAFTPRLAEGAWLAAQPNVRAMMDVSDGLAKDLHAITPRRTAPALEGERIPLRKGANLRAALSDGEDYELLFALSQDADREGFARKWRRVFPRVRLSCVGQFVAAGSVPLNAIPLAEFHGYEHLR